MEWEIEISLFQRLRRGEVAAFDEIFDKLNRRLYRFARRMTGNCAVAEDLVEETWLRFVSAVTSLDEETQIARWLYTVIRNLCISYCRSRARGQYGSTELISMWPDQSPRSPLNLTLSKEFEEQLEAAIVALPSKYREALLLVGIEGFHPAEAAVVCGISSVAFRQRLSRGRMLLTKRLVDEGWISPELRKVNQ